MLMRACPTFTGIERRNGGESPGARPILHVHDRRHAMACALPGTGSRGTDRRGASFTHIGA